ncbi:hypothetical protein PVAG01_03615 [Phlyctema vagabunda]|uniref:Mid2 domain-containing protein n=1 Tax=Phlyctema vagabunda TaxID=108571 RepID=A0ABR4PM08_9HELO
MSLFWKQCVYLQYAVWFLCSTAYGIATFTNPTGPDGSLSLTMGEQFLVVWQDADTDYSLLSLGVMASSDGNIFWLVSNDEDYPTQNYLYTVGLGNGITLSQGNVFSFVLVNGTNFGLFAQSHTFVIKAASSATTTSSSATSSTSSSSSSATSASSTASSAIPTTSSPVATTTGAAPAVTSQPASTGGPSNGMSTGAKVGVGVAVPVVALIGIVAALMVCRRRRKARAAENHYLTAPNDQQEPKYTYVGASEAPTPYNQEQVFYEAPAGKHQIIHEAP